MRCSHNLLKDWRYLLLKRIFLFYWIPRNIYIKRATGSHRMLTKVRFSQIIVLDMILSNHVQKCASFKSCPEVRFIQIIAISMLRNFVRSSSSKILQFEEFAQIPSRDRDDLVRKRDRFPLIYARCKTPMQTLPFIK